MTSPWQYALTVGPLAFYLWLLALWQSGRHPRVVRGLVDFGWLAFGVGGLLAFGPFGTYATAILFGHPDATDRLAFFSALGLFASLLGRRALHRFSVYNVDAGSLDQALRDVLSRDGRSFARTLGGFEEAASGRGLRVEFAGRVGCASVEAYGRDPEGFVQEIRGPLRERLRVVSRPPSPVAFALYLGSLLVMIAPLFGLVLSQPHTRQALRALIHRLSGV